MKRSTAKILIAAIVLVGIVIFLQNRFSQFKSTSHSRSGPLKLAQSGVTAQIKSPDEVSLLNFENKEETLKINDKIALHAIIDPKGKSVTASELHVVFNPKILKLESIDPSDVFTLVLSGSQIDNEKGEGSIVVGVPPGQKSVDKSSAIATFNFQAIATGNSEVNFSDKSVAAAEDASGNVIGTRMGTVITVK
jgi:hypothetical protein